MWGMGLVFDVVAGTGERSFVLLEEGAPGGGIGDRGELRGDVRLTLGSGSRESGGGIRTQAMRRGDFSSAGGGGFFFFLGTGLGSTNPPDLLIGPCRACQRLRSISPTS